MYRRSGELSELARGQGLLCGGVEVECFADDLKAFTLTGQPILKPTETIYGKTTKPYRKHQLAIPKTYVTRRGQMVLFTSSDDMIFGKSCQIHKKDVTTQNTVKQLKTTNKLFTSAMGYNAADVSNRDVGHTGDLTVRAGHFTNVYLNSLQKAAQTQRAALQAAEECMVEDIEGESGEKKGDRAAVSSITCYAQIDGESEAPLVECDSGLGHSISTSASGRLSAQSHVSESVANTTVIHIPHGRDSQHEDTDGEHERHADMDKKNSVNALDALKMELNLSHKSKEQSTVKKKTGKKRRQAMIGDKSQNEKSLKATKSKKRSSGETTSITRKSSKVKRKRNKAESSSSMSSTVHKVDKGVEAVMEFSVEHESINESTEEKKLEVTAVQLPGKESTGSNDRDVAGRLSRAEQRRMEIERKRAEKRALELEKKRQEEEQMRLQALIDQQHTETEHEDTLFLESPKNDEQEDAVKMDADISVAHDNILTVEQKSLRNRLTHAKLRENRLLLAYRGEKMEAQLSDDIQSAEEALRLAQEAKEKRERLKQEQEERLRRLEDERRQREELTRSSKTVDEKATKIREERNKSMHQDLANQRIYQNVSKSFMFSYFRFVPPPKPKVEKKTRKVRASKSQPPK